MKDNLSPYNADSYEDGLDKTMPFYKQFYSETIEIITFLKPEANVRLGTGCGRGSMLHATIPSFKKKTFLIADTSSKILNQAHLKLSHIPENKLEIIGNTGTEKLPDIKPHAPQVITAILAHHYFNKEQRNIATRRCYELLENDGVYVTFENIYPQTECGMKTGLGRWKAFQQSQGKTEEEASDHINRYNKSFFPISVDEHLSVLKKAGFKVAELFWYSNMQAGIYAIK